MKSSGFLKIGGGAFVFCGVRVAGKRWALVQFGYARITMTLRPEGVTAFSVVVRSLIGGADCVFAF
jgi:hypothetical protein